ncbi:AraC family transcriptional regulator [Stenotrophobium rhamnosiphilum]|uniref:HTH araC/xylS-type domain-containing protein n=1 Tax=Stenotrophobium rhamnosiphilum TaxID=2029166 RepID=A0A2T5MKL9_9GAMM|nr:AraC family transcriptional regulator [Stenotrophobium rhamnosiphilum]PTU33126.1 hypothetical protein CJD38_03200 [Stenotrophobium rhamnosiphilum]
MKRPDRYAKPTVPVSYLQLLLEIVAEHGIDTQELFKGLPVSPNLVDSPASRMSALQWGLLVNRAMRLLQEPALGYECGLRTRPSAHGFLGYAVLSCASVRESMELVIRYFQTRQRDFGIRMLIEQDYAAVEVFEFHPIIPTTKKLPTQISAAAPDAANQLLSLRRFFYEHILLGVARGAAAMLGRELLDLGGELCFDWAEPEYHARWKDRLPPVRFSRSSNQLRFPIRLLEMRPVLADPLATKQAIELCERELAQTGAAGDSIVLRVCAELIQAKNGGYPDQETLAAKLHISSRTLARKLKDDGSSFQQLLEETQRRDACDLIENTELDLQEVATRLGYQNPANFTRAFRKWTGESPSLYRLRCLNVSS